MPDDESMLLIQSLGLKDELPKPGYNMEGGSVFDNYVKAQRDGQFFLIANFLMQYEKPLSEPIEAKSLRWCSNLHFTGSSNGTYTRGVGYTAQCVFSFVDDPAEMKAEGAELPYVDLTLDEFAATQSLSATYNTHSNMFDMALHKNGDNNVFLYSDTGLSTMPYLAWEVHDEGDTHPNADTSSWSLTGQMTWVSKEEAALLLNKNASEFTPEKFDDIYKKVWNDNHAYATAQQTTTDTDENSTNEEEEGTTDADTDESSGNDMDSVATEDTEEEPGSDTIEEADKRSASNGRRLFVAITSMFSTILGSSV